MPIKLLIADDHEIVRLGLRAAVSQSSDMEVVAEAFDGVNVVLKALSCVPDVVLMDIRMPRTDGIEATKQIKSDLHLKDTRVLIFTSNDNQNDLFAALGAGADGYCVKDTPAEQLILAIQTVHSGATWLDPQIARLVLSTATASQAKERSSVSARPAPPFALSAREMDVLRLLVEGLSNSEMADRLIISIETVKTHMRRIMEKLQVSDRTQAAVKAMRAGLV